MFRKKREKLYIPLIMNIYFNDNGNTRPVFRPCKGNHCHSLEVNSE